MLLITLVLILLTGVFFLLIRIRDKSIYEWYECFGFIVGCLTLLVVLGFLVAMPLARWESTDYIESVEAIQYTYDQSRDATDLTEFERATLTQSIMEVNSTIAARQNKHTIWRSKLWQDDAILDLKFIE